MNILIASLILILPLAAQAEVHRTNTSDRPVHEGEIPWTLSSTLTLTSEYMDRGVSATDEHPTVQSEVILAHDSGFYVGAWASGIDYNDDESKMELDVFAGYGTAIGEHTWVDAYLIRYTFPGADQDLDYDFYELATRLGHDFGFAEVIGSFYYTPSNFADSGDFYYPNLTAKVPLTESGFYTAGEVGYLDIDDEARYAAPDYAHWRLGIGYDAGTYDARIDYHDTDLSEAECADVCGPRVVFSVSRDF